jgi:hypothetical protein
LTYRSQNDHEDEKQHTTAEHCVIYDITLVELTRASYESVAQAKR